MKRKHSIKCKNIVQYCFKLVDKQTLSEALNIRS